MMNKKSVRKDNKILFSHFLFIDIDSIKNLHSLVYAGKE